MADQRAQRGIDMPLVVQSRESLHDIFEEGQAGELGAAQKVIIILEWMIARGTVRTVM